MDWEKMLLVGFLVGMLFILVPRIKPMLQKSRQGSNAEWFNVLCILVAVAGFVWLLMNMV